VVLWMYASSDGTWPPGHPWSGVALSMMAIQCFIPHKAKSVWVLVVASCTLVSALLWGLTRVADHEAERDPPVAPPTGDEVKLKPIAYPPGSVEAAAATALAKAAELAASCHPKGGPTGDGEIRVAFAQDGSVASADVLTPEFQNNLTGSCVRMVFRRAKAPAFSAPVPTFIKSFSIPAE